ncbi:hypothetical protein C8R42DRAFT_722008 [Lentinula raphanica]|nr:hypothetical protein C8R42DRAFT_722008 [Lentinula raphanica]
MAAFATVPAELVNVDATNSPAGYPGLTDAVLPERLGPKRYKDPAPRHRKISMQIFNEQVKNIARALALGDLVKSALGPKGMHKILRSAAIQLSNTASKILVKTSKPRTMKLDDENPESGLLEALEAAAVDHSLEPANFGDHLYNIARTTLSFKVLLQEKGYFADLAVDTVPMLARLV